jgi:Ni/Co efflux regulator RcnB
MRTRAFIPGVMTLSLVFGGMAFAQGEGDPVAQERARRQMDRQMRHITQQACPGHAARARNPRFQRDERGAGPDRAFRQGDCLPLEYRNRNYVVDDWRGHRLDAPPAGYQWVQLGGDYVLVARDSGLIRQLRLHH